MVEQMPPAGTGCPPFSNRNFDTNCHKSSVVSKQHPATEVHRFDVLAEQVPPLALATAEATTCPCYFLASRQALGCQLRLDNIIRIRPIIRQSRRVSPRRRFLDVETWWQRSPDAVGGRSGVAGTDDEPDAGRCRVPPANLPPHEAPQIRRSEQGKLASLLDFSHRSILKRGFIPSFLSIHPPSFRALSPHESRNSDETPTAVPPPRSSPRLGCSRHLTPPLFSAIYSLFFSVS